MGPWSTLEYIAIATETKAAAPSSTFYLSSLPTALASSLPPALTPNVDGTSFVATSSSVETLATVSRGRVCLLDPQAPQTLSPADADRFDWFVFGGILGWCAPPRRIVIANRGVGRGGNRR